MCLQLLIRTKEMSQKQNTWRTKKNEYSTDGKISQCKNYLLLIKKLRIKTKEDSGIKFYFLPSYIKDLYVKMCQSRHTQTQMQYWKYQ